MTYYLGIDPDVKCMGFALWSDSYGPHWVGVAKIPTRLSKEAAVVKQAEASAEVIRFLTTKLRFRFGGVALESQQKDRRVMGFDAHTSLSQVTGAVLGSISSEVLACPIRVVKPWEWKKSQKKHAMQARLYTDLGWGWTKKGEGSDRFAIPTNLPQTLQGADRLKPNDWKHVGDALLLARWAYLNIK